MTRNAHVEKAGDRSRAPGPADTSSNDEKAEEKRVEVAGQESSASVYSETPDVRPVRFRRYPSSNHVLVS